jgi:IS30 family transposase
MRGGHITESERGQAAVLAAQGHTVARIAATLGRGVRTIERALARPEAAQVRARILASTVQDARAVLAANAARAAERVVELVESDRDDTALRAAGSVLDRVGVVQQQHVAILTSTPDEELRQEYLAAVELLRSRGEL